ncbi:hypothetical protein H8959_001553, partial [Pygathrix nigripes]
MQIASGGFSPFLYESVRFFAAKFTSELRGSSTCWLKFVLAHPKARLQSLQFIMELLYWLLEGGDSEDKEDATGNVEMKNTS